jgi:hypothetical protein
LEFAFSSLAIASDEQYESIPDDEIAQLERKFHALHKFRKERRSPRVCFECGDTIHLIADYSKRKTLAPPTSTTTPTKTTIARATTRRRIASGTRRRRRSSRRSSPECVLP